MKVKFVQAVQTLSFYLSNFIIVSFIGDLYKEESLEHLLVLAGAILAIVGALSALCYAAYTVKRNDYLTRIFGVAGDRLLHCFISLVFAFLFIGTIIKIKHDGLFTIKNNTAIFFVTIILIPFATTHLFWAGRSFIVAFHMLREVLNRRFPLKDEELFDDLHTEENKPQG